MVSSSTRFTDDIILEIFAHLPLNSIYKFKCLSKVWLSNLSDPNFIIKWFHFNNKSLPWIQYLSIHDEDDDENPIKFKMAYNDLHSELMSKNDHLFSFKFLMNQKPFGSKLLMLGSSNGLVLCVVSLYPEKMDVKYHVCNPLTQKWVSLPSPPRTKIGGFDICGIFGEPSCYKVVRIPEFDRPSNKFNVDIFSSDLGVWESFQVSCDGTVESGYSNFDKVVILNGVLYWIEGGHRMLVYKFNQKNKSDRHRCSLINLPDMEFEDANFHNCHSRIGESEGRVCFAKTEWTGKVMTVTVWVLNEVNWQILHKDISLYDVLVELLSRIGEKEVGTIQVLGFSPVDRNVILLGCRHWVWVFNIQTKEFEDLWLNNKHHAGLMFHPFVLKPMPTVLPLPSWINNEK